MAVISLLTDFGIEDEYAGVMKGVILSINPAAVIVDLTHQVGAQQILQAALLIRSAYRFFPAKTVHVIVVDPGVGSARAILAYKTREHIFLAPDNGVLTLVLEEAEEAEAVVVENRNYFLSPVSKTFHGRDIFAPVAAHLSLGTPLGELGPALNPDRIARLDICRPVSARRGELSARVIAVDHFGNLTTNVELNALSRYGIDPTDALLSRYGIDPTDALIVIGSATVGGISRRYVDVPAGRPLVLTGSRGLLEIAVNRGSAQAMFNAAVGDTVRILKRRRHPGAYRR